LKTVLRWIGYLVGAVVALIVILIAGVYFNYNRILNTVQPNPVPQMTVSSTPALVARGAYMAAAMPGCGGCHSSNPAANPPVLDGGKIDAAPLAVFYPPNLTPGGPLKDWSDGEVVRAIREGVGKDGKPLLLMPSHNLKNLSDEDVQALVAYLRSQPAVSTPTPEHNVMFLGVMLIGSGQFPPSNQPSVASVTAPPMAPTAEYGRYLVNATDCRDCHGPKLDGTGTPPGPPPGPSLVIVKGWTEEQFIKTIREGVDPSGHQLSDEMPWKEYGRATDNDLKAIYAYLRSL
jgi:mono/diheme cytochrome c family protein